MRHIPLWFDRFPKARRPSYPALRGESEAAVVVVGAGLTGAACALTLATSGYDVVILESAIAGSGMTAGSPGVIREGFAGSVQQAVALHGLRATRAVWDGVRRAGLDMAAAIRRHGIRCNLEAQDLITLARRDTEAARLLRREYETRHSAGIEGSWMSGALVTRETALESGGGIRTRGFVLDPYRACVGMLAAAARRGARIHERSTVRRIRLSRKRIEIVTEKGTVRSDWVVVATGAPIQDLGSLRRHVRPVHEYGVLTGTVAAPVRRRLGRRAAALEHADASLLVRWMAEDRVLVHGARQAQLPQRARDRALTQRTGELMYGLLLLYPDIAGLQPEWSWDSVDYRSPDGLPLIGPHRLFPRHFFALGSWPHGAGTSWLAARMALRFLQGAPNRGDEFLGFARIL